MSIFQIASNKAIGEWYIRKVLGHAITETTRRAEVLSSRKFMAVKENNCGHDNRPEVFESYSKNQSVIQPTEPVSFWQRRRFADDELNTFGDVTSANESGLSTHPFGDHSDFEVTPSTIDFYSDEVFQGLTESIESSLSSSVSNRKVVAESQASRLCDLFSERLENSSLTLNTIQNALHYREGRFWLANGAMQAKPKQRRRLLVRLANALLLDSEEKRIPDHGLDDALGLLDLADRERCESDLELDALTVATRLSVDNSRKDDSKSLNALKAIDHPIAFSNRVRLLFLRGQVGEAFELVHHNKLHVRWAEIAAAISARQGRISDAIEICQSMRNGGVDGADDPNLVTIRYFRCLMMVADEFFRRAFVDRNVGDRLYLDLLSESEAKQLTELLDILSPIVSKVFGAGRISNGIERQSLEIALNAAHLIGDQERAVRIANLLASASPISRQVPLAIRAGYLTADFDILNRLQTDWPSDLDISVSVCELAAIHFNNSKFALSKIDALTKSDLNEEQVSGLATVLLSVYQHESGELKDKAFSLLAGLVGADHFLLRMAEAVSAMDKKDWSVAERLLNGAVHRTTQSG